MWLLSAWAEEEDDNDNGVVVLPLLPVEEQNDDMDDGTFLKVKGFCMEFLSFQKRLFEKYEIDRTFAPWYKLRPT